MDLIINSRLVIPHRELQWRFSRASGPGGQSVNTSDSRVELVFDVNSSSVLGLFLKNRLIIQLNDRMVGGCLRVVASEERSQYQNRQLALVRLAELLREGLKQPPKPRKLTKPTYAAQRRRFNAKQHKGKLKQMRQHRWSTDD